ncbi:MerR family DNA-binding transcriptional regulator [Mycobacterium sp. CnD-18-1]|uniref:MerR family DNA-binding transcriptional regulator n=1 Tax=Mycobacterium sp. CnD-18-1 TaxID=2917744 RepID=UPI0035B42391
MGMPIVAPMEDGYTHSEERIAIGEVAKRFGVTVGTVRNWERQGRITAVRTPGGQRRFRRSDIESLLAAEAPA